MNWVGERDKALETAIKKSPDFPPNISQRFLKTLSEFGDGGEDSDEGEDNDGEEEEDMGDKGKEKEEEEEEELAEEDKTVDWEGITYLEDDKPDQTVFLLFSFQFFLLFSFFFSFLINPPPKNRIVSFVIKLLILRDEQPPVLTNTAKPQPTSFVSRVFF